MISLNFFLFPFITSFSISLICIYIFTKEKILLDQVNYSKHKKLIFTSSTKAPLCGGIIIFICSLFFFNEIYLLKIFGFFLLFLGIFSDNNKIQSPKIRILIQLFIVVFYLFFSGIGIVDLRITSLNNLLDIKYVSIIFTFFCFLILINGTNFLDGLNTLVIGYYILVLSFLILVSQHYNLSLDYNAYFLIIFLFVIYIFNFFGKIYLGDSGAYLISFFVGFFVIDFVTNNAFVSPYFISFLLWYPAFENLLSIMRRLSFNKKVYKPDQFHLHHLIFKYFVKNNFFNKKFVNSITANIINFYNFLIFILFYKYIFFTKIMISVIFMNIFLYLVIYYYLKKRV